MFVFMFVSNKIQPELELALVVHLQLAVVAKVIVHVLDAHAVRLCGDVVHQLRWLCLVVVHGALVLEQRAARVCSVGVEVVAQTLDADTTKDTEDVALMLVEFCGKCQFLSLIRLYRTYLGELHDRTRSDLHGGKLGHRSSSNASGVDSC